MPKPSFRGGGPRGFTLVELLAGVAIVSILTALVISGIGDVMRSQKVAATSSNMRQIGTAINLYAADNEGQLPGPMGVSVFNYARAVPLDGDPANLAFYIGGYLGAKPTYPGFSITSSYYWVKTLACPALPAAVQRNAAVSGFCMMDLFSKPPLYTFGGNISGSVAPNGNLIQARAVQPRPKRLGALSAEDRQTAFLCTSDREILPASILLPATGVFGGKRLWLFLDGSVALATNNTAWKR